MARNAIWSSIAAALKAEIAAGGYGPGAKLPTEAQLAQRFGVNRHTVRHALAALAEDGLVQPRRGAGVFVTSVPTDYALGRRVRFHQNVLKSGRTPSRRILRIETRPASPPEAEALALPPGQKVHLVEGISLADGLPLGLFRSALPASRFPDFPEAMTRTGSITAALAEAGVTDYTRAMTRLTAKSADAVQAGHLQVAQGAALMRSVTVNVDGAGVPVEFGITWFVGDRVTLTVIPD
ncbi:phosphonate metabolism transcriptional regulator PhnF [bacterium]|nr:phosphonate metabolism transcriptional regulator PhnF [bacterium]